MKIFNARFGAWALLFSLLGSPFVTVLPAQTFTNVMATVGLPQVGQMSVSWADYDKDGRLDLLAGANVWRNTESGFTNVTASVAPGLPAANGISAWTDYDGDGLPDFFITGYRTGSNGNYTTVSELWRNTGNGFTNVTASVLPGMTPGTVTWGDYDNDGRLDFFHEGYFISQIWRNTGSNFVNVTDAVAPGLTGVSGGSVAWGDYDNDGRLDLILTGGIPRRSDQDDNWPYYTPISQIWRNTGSGFVNVTATVAPGLTPVYWSSVAWGDYDNDGRLDLLLTGSGNYYSSTSQLWRNTGNGFVNVTAAVASALPGVYRGPAAWGDYDNDGRLDILLSGHLYRNTGSGFTKATATDAPGLSQVVSSSLAWGDYDSDGRLDFVLSGKTYEECDVCDPAPTVFQLWKNNIEQSSPKPAVITDPPGNVGPTSVALNARINPRGQLSTAWFIWGNSTNYGNVTAPQPMGNGNSFTNFSQSITGLSTGVIYYYRAVGSNDQGLVFLGFEQRFTLTAPFVYTHAGGSVNPNSATFSGQAFPDNLPVYGWFEWGLTPAYGQTTPVQFLGSGLNAGFGENVFGLAGSTTYYFRAVASNSLGVAYGTARTLVTPSTIVCPGSLSPTSKSFSYHGASSSTYVLLQCNWSAINTNSWITITSGGSGNASGSRLYYTVAMNSGPQSRSGSIMIGGHNFLVTQGGNNTAPPATNTSCIYQLYPAGVNHGYGATMGSVTVAAPTTCAWEVWNTNSWITILSNASGMGNGQFAYAVEANTGMPSRSGNVTVGERNYAVTQAGRSVSPPVDQIVALGGTATFSAIAYITPPFTYQWQFNGVNLVDGDGISGATTSNLVLTGVQYSQGGNYRVVVSNSSGTAASSSALLTVAPTNNTLPVAEAVDTGDMLFWKTWADSRGNWFGQTNTTHDGVDALEGSGLAPGAYASVEAKSGGSGILSFWWKTAFAAPSDGLIFWMGNSPPVALASAADWEQRTFIVPGDMDLRWTFSNSSTGEQSKAWLDQVQFTPCNFNLSPGYGEWVSSLGFTGKVTLTTAAYCSWHVVNTNSWITILSSEANTGSGSVNYAVAANPTTAYRNGYIVIADREFYITQYPSSSTNAEISLTEALDTSGSLDWSTIGTPEWFGQAVMSRDGADAAQSGPVGHSAAVTATTTVNGPGTILFWWKVSSETNKDYLKFFINGVQQTRISGEVDWQLVSYNLFSGYNTLKWTYSKNNDETAGNDRGWLDQVQFVPTPETGLCAVAVSPISAAHSPSPGTGSVSVVVAAGCAWDVVNTNSWITYTAGPDLVRYTVSTNNSRNQRTGVLLIGGRPFTVTQPGGLPPCSYYVSPSALNIPPAAYTGSFTVSTDSGCGWNIINTNPWITIVASPINSSSGYVTYSVPQNTSIQPRLGYIRLGDRTFALCQYGATITLAEGLDTVGTPLSWSTWSYPWIAEGDVTHDGVDAAQSGAMPDYGSSALQTTVNGPGTLSFWWKVSSETNYDSLRLSVSGVELARISGDVDWQQYSLTLPVGSRPIQWNYSKDSSLVAGQDRGWVDQVQFIPISGCPATLSSGNASLPSDSSTGSVNVAIAPGCQWGVFNQNSWISIVSGSNGTGNGSVTYTVAANPTAYTRIGNIQIADQVFVVSQSGITTPPSNCTYTGLPSAISRSYTSSTGTVFVTAPSSCEWNVLNTNDWITITSSLTNFGSGQVTFSVAQNPAPFARSGPIRVAGQIFTVNQSAAPGGCPITLSPGNASHSSSSATGLVSVTAPLGCPWSVLNTNSWISIVSPTNGSGNGSVTYVVAANTTPSVRGGNVWIAGQLFFVTQSGASPQGCTISISPDSTSYSYQPFIGAVSVTAQSGCEWNVLNTNAWITITSSLTNFDSGQVAFSVSENPAPVARSGQFRVAGQIFTVNQSAAPANPLAEALDTIGTSLVWPPSSIFGWSAQSTVTHDGVDAAQSANDGESSSFSISVTGPGTLSFWWKISAGIGSDSLSFHIDDVEQFRISGEVDWEQRTLTVPAGTRTLSWFYARFAGTDGAHLGWVDQVQFVPTPCSFTLSPGNASHSYSSATGLVSVAAAPGCPWIVVNTNAWVTILSSVSNSGSGQVIYSISANNTPAVRLGYIRIDSQVFAVTQSGHPNTNNIPLPEALDTTSTPLVWITGGTIPWLGQALVSHDGVDAAQCAAPGGSGSGSGGLQTTVTGPGTLSFWWKVSSEANNDTLRLYVNGVAQTGISGEVDWQQSSLTLPAGSQALEWRYSKNAAISAGQDRGWVDQVQYVPEGCTISLSPASASHGSSSSTGIVSVTAWNCAWGVVNTNPWVTILSGTTTNAAGSGMLVYRVATNSSGSARSGNIRIGGQQFLLTQSGTSVPGANAARLHFVRRTQTNATLSVQGEPGKMYVVQCSEDLIQWIPISTNLAPSTVTDTAAGNAPHRFYRTVEIP